MDQAIQRQRVSGYQSRLILTTYLIGDILGRTSDKIKRHVIDDLGLMPEFVTEEQDSKKRDGKVGCDEC